MKVKLILPSLTEAKSAFWRPIKYSLFPPLGLATLAAYLDINDEIDLQDQHIEKLTIDDFPDLVIYHILTPYPGTRLFDSMINNGRIITTDWDLYDTRHVVYESIGMTAAELEEGYWWAYNEFYKWNNVFKASLSHEKFEHQLKHLLYTGGWKKFESLWNVIINTGGIKNMLPLLELLLSDGRKKN